jgi:hypothetical protein
VSNIALSSKGYIMLYENFVVMAVLFVLPALGFLWGKHFTAKRMSQQFKFENEVSGIHERIEAHHTEVLNLISDEVAGIGDQLEGRDRDLDDRFNELDREIRERTTEAEQLGAPV